MAEPTNSDAGLDLNFLRTVQAGSGLIFSTFMALHIPTTISAVLGPFGYNEALKLFRKFYQNPLIEAGLALSLVAHVGSSVALMSHRAQADTPVKEPWYVDLNRAAGTFLLFAMPGHVGATRILSLIGKWRPSEYDSIRATFVGPISLLFIPYYVLLAASGIYHTYQGVLLSARRYQWIPVSWYRKIAENKLWYAAIGSVIIAALAGLNGFRTIEGIPESAAYWTFNLPLFGRVTSSSK